MYRKIHQQLMRRRWFVVGAVLLGILLFVLWAPARQIPLPVIVGSSIAGVIGALIIGGYYYKWSWTGLTDAAYQKVDGVEFQRGKTLWDWLQLLIIPSVLAGAALLFNAQSTQTQLNITTDNQREAALQAYIDKMSELLLDGKLRTSERGSEIRSVARTRTLSTLRQLDSMRKGQVLQFLHESQLISRTDAVIALEGANLAGANLAGANLAGANLAGANLAGANLAGADLTEADLTEADLTEADLTWTTFYSATLSGTTLIEANLSGTTLSKANLRGANLRGADLTLATLASASLSGATLIEANLARADLIGADLTGVKLEGANLEEAFLGGVEVTQEQLAEAKSLSGATMPGGSIHP